jgi:D-amino-acid dehydrogenase
MSGADTTEIAVIGAGVIGLTVALWLADAGRTVVLLDPDEPGAGASHGNAGTIADYAVQPVGTPDVLRALPSLLFDRDSPLAIRRAAIPTLAPWLARFLWQSRPGAARRNAAALAALLSDAAPRWRALAARIGGAGLLRDRGCLYAYRSAAAVRAAQADMAQRRSLGVAVEIVDGATLAGMEPALAGMAGGAFFPDALFMVDPGRMVGLVAAAAAQAGVALRAARATGLSRDAGGVTVTGPGLRLRARHVVVAAGARSRALARAAGDRVPLDTERGYHLEWDMAEPPFARPCCPVAQGFYFCPMDGRLRVAGTVELGGVDAPPAPHRWARLEAGARAVLPDLPPPDRRWMGLRPSIPDSLPVIGPSRGGPGVIHAFGHGHIGLTLAPVTADLVAALIEGRDPGPVLAPCLPGRF